MFHLCTDLPPWGPSHRLRRIDLALAAGGSTAVVLPWHTLELQADGLHFSRSGMRDFAECLVEEMCKARTLHPFSSLLVLCDSTIGHNDAHARDASLVRSLFARRGVRAVVDAVCGSGFVAGSFPDNQHFRARLSGRLRRGERYDAILFIGGWNDALLFPNRDPELPVEAACRVSGKLLKPAALTGT